MAIDLKDLAFKAITFDMTPEEVRIAGKVLFVASWRAALIVGFAIIFGTNYFARAADIEKKTEEKLQALAVKQSNMDLKLAGLSYNVNYFLARSLAGDIRLVYAKMCAADRAKDWNEKERLRDELDQKQDDYRMLRDDRKQYGPLSCGSP